MNIPNNSAKDINGYPRASGTNHDDIEGIRHDIESLKANVSYSLSKNLQRDGQVKAGEIKTALNDGIDVLISKGDQGIVAIEGQVKENPRRSVAIAFVAGFLANILLRRS